MERKEAIEIIKKNYPHVGESGSQFETALRILIPELKESEDERIRKAILEHIQLCTESIPDRDKFIAWLEKQKTSEEALQYLRENHSSSEMSDFQAAMNIAVAKAYDKGYNDGLEKQGEPNPYSGVSFKYNSHTWGMCARDEGVDILCDKHIIGHLEKQGEQKPNPCDGCINRKGCINCENGELREVEQKPAWSEGDENGLGDALWAIQQARTIAKDENDMGNLWYAEHWLNSLKDRVQVQSQWKPSDEMLKALYRAIPENVMEISEDEMLLDKLYQGLKYGKVLSKN